MLIKIDNKYGAKVGNIQVFTHERAIEVYKMFVELCYRNITMESSVVLSQVTDDMHRLGYSFSELEDMEIETISKPHNLHPAPEVTRAERPTYEKRNPTRPIPKKERRKRII